MNAPIEYQTISEAGVARFAVVPIDQFNRLLTAAGQAEATIPNAVVSATVDGTSPARAWREHLGLAQQDVAQRMGISQPAYAQMEAPDAKLRKTTRSRIAQALGIAQSQLDF